MRQGLREAMVILLTVALVGCGGSASRATTDAGRSDRLTREQIGDTAYADLYELILARRGTWLRTRGPDSFRNNSQIQVYRDDVRLGGVEVLRAMHPMEIEYVRFYDPVQASSRWGFDHGAGVIYVATRRD
jgi:hypothetical protein